MRRPRVRTELLVGLTAAALFFAVMSDLAERHERAKAAPMIQHFDAIHASYIAMCDLGTVDTPEQCEGRWQRVISK